MLLGTLSQEPIEHGAACSLLAGTAGQSQHCWSRKATPFVKKSFQVAWANEAWVSDFEHDFQHTVLENVEESPRNGRGPWTSRGRRN